jgi:peptide/nickel transport system ATP-binding protein
MSPEPPSRTDADVLLKVEHLTTEFDRAGTIARAADDVSFTVRRGESVGLVGESGCGKSVTALSIMRLVRPPGRIVSGTIAFDGRDLLALGERDMQAVRGAQIAYIFQEPAAALNPVFTVGDQVAETLVVHGRATPRAAREQAVRLLETVRIAGPDRTARAYPHQLSGGMRQRVLIAMALACRPALVIADEPTTALDATIQREILDLLQELKDAYRLSLLLITHDLRIVSRMADRVLVMYAGRIVEAAPTRSAFRSPSHPYTKALLAVAGPTVRQSGSPTVRPKVPEPGSPNSRGPGSPKVIPPPPDLRTPGPSDLGTCGPDSRNLGPSNSRTMVRPRLPVIDGTVPDLSALPAGCAFEPRCEQRFGRCAAEAPAVTELGAERAVRCHLFSSSADESGFAAAESAGSELHRGARPRDSGGT